MRADDRLCRCSRCRESSSTNFPCPPGANVYPALSPSVGMDRCHREQAALTKALLRRASRRGPPATGRCDVLLRRSRRRGLGSCDPTHLFQAADLRHAGSAPDADLPAARGLRSRPRSFRERGRGARHDRPLGRTGGGNRSGSAATLSFRTPSRRPRPGFASDAPTEPKSDASPPPCRPPPWLVPGELPLPVSPPRATLPPNSPRSAGCARPSPSSSPAGVQKKCPC